MASSKQIEASLLTEHLRYTPLTLLDDIINTVNELVNRAVDAAEEGLLQADASKLGFAAPDNSAQADAGGKPVIPEARAEIEEGVHQLETLLEANVDKNFDKLEIYLLRNPLSVPHDLVPWIRLSHYQDVPLPVVNKSNDASSPTPESLQLLRRKLQQTRRLHNALQTTVNRNNKIIAELQELTKTSVDPQAGSAGVFSFLNSGPSTGLMDKVPNAKNDTSAGTKPSALETDTSFALAQLPALRALLDQLRPKLSALESVSAEPAHEDKLPRERRIYLEIQGRQAIERQGIGIGDNAVESGARIVAADELMAIEDMADGLARPNDDESMEE